ncbi:MAG: PhoU domain-containing protein [Candidatus Omnitrophota bacterium]|nr:MAG: PhoU domain-containing protein [Candidatus Omnitrophota bacterium]
MFKNLLQFWKGKDFLSHVLDDFKGMLDDTEEMFLIVCRKLIHNQEEPGLRDKVYSLDRKVNALEKDIRKRVLEPIAGKTFVVAIASGREPGPGMWRQSDWIEYFSPTR